MNQERIVTKKSVDVTSNWLEYPLKSEDKIMGEPNCKINMIRATGAVTPVHQAMILTVQPSTFRYRFENDESWIVLEGRVTITIDDGEIVKMEKGDMVSILGGRNSTWQVHESFKKFVVITSGK